MVAYFHLSRIARNFNTEHLELITGLYAEKMNDSMEYLQNYVQEDIKMIRSMENAQPEEILEQLEKNLDKTVFGDIGFIMNDGEIYGGSSCAVSDIKRRSWMRRRWLRIRLLTRIIPVQQNWKYDHDRFCASRGYFTGSYTLCVDYD